MANAHRVVMKRDEDEDDEMEPQQALPVPDGGAEISCDWQHRVPTTAEEYLRMVRQEASQVPDIVSKPMDSSLSRSTSKFHQLAAQFEDVASCPDEFMPSAEWEDCYLEYFSSVRERAKPPTLSQIAKTDSRARGEILWTIANILKQNSTDPTLMQGHGGSWLFSILVALDRPSDPDTTAALRSIVRSLCARRSELEDCNAPQLPSLNVLITIIGSYFGQLETRSVPQQEEEEEWEEEEGWEEEEEGCEETGPQDIDLEVRE